MKKNEQNNNGDSVTLLADSVVQDIVRKGLAPGDRYLTTVQAGTMLGVSPATANRVMARLATEGVLNRRARSGTFISNNFKTGVTKTVKTVLVLQPDSRRTSSNFDYSLLMSSLLSEIDEITVQFCFFPDANPIPFIRSALEPIYQRHQLGGVVAMNCPFEVYNHLDKSKAPIVIVGRPFPGQEDMHALMYDMEEAGRLMADYFIQRGYLKIAALMPAQSSPGDNQLIDGITDQMTHGGLAPNGLLYRPVSGANDLFRAQVHQILQSSDPPRAYILNNRPMADRFAQIVKEMNYSIPDDLEIIHFAHAYNDSVTSDFPHVRTKLTYVEVMQQIALKLKDVIQGTWSGNNWEMFDVMMESGRNIKTP